MKKYFSLIVLLISIILLSQTGQARTEEDFTFQIKHPLTVPKPDCPQDKPWLELKEPDTSYYVPKLENLQSLNEYLSPLTITRPEFPYESICEKITDPACDIFKIIHERDKVAEAWNNSDIVKQAQSDILEVKSKNKEIEDKNKKISKFNNSEIIHRIKLLNSPKTDSGKIVGISDFIITPKKYSFIYDNLKAESPFQKRALHYFKYSLSDFYTLEKTQEPNEYLKRTISNNPKIKERNQIVEQKNQEIEKQNAEAMKKFHEIYTPEKLNQLLNDYDSLLKQNCVSKTTDKDLYMTQSDCKTAKEEREFIEDKEKHSRYGICRLKNFGRYNLKQGEK